MKIKSLILFFLVFPILLFGYSSAYYSQSSVDTLSVVGSGGVVGDEETGVFGNIGTLKSAGFFYYDFGLQNMNKKTYFNPVNFAFQFNLKINSFFGGRITSTLLDDSSNVVNLHKHFFGLSGNLHNLYWGGKLLYYTSENMNFNTFGHGFGVSVGLIKIVNNMRFGLNYSSPVYLKWKENSDLIFINYVAPEFNLGMSYSLDNNKDFFLSARYVFPQVRISGSGVVRNALLYKEELDISIGMEINYKFQSFKFSNSVGFKLLPNNQLGTVSSGEWTVRAGLGFDVKYKNVPAVLKLAYSQEFIKVPMNVFKIGILWTF